MTTSGGIGHTTPLLIPNFQVAFTTAVGVVLAELATITRVRHRFMDTPVVSAVVLAVKV